MSFQNLGKVETADFYIDVAFRRGKQKADLIKQKLQKADRVKKTNKPRIQIFVSVERERFRAVNRTLTSNLSSILTSFPSIDALPRFYLELVKCTIDYGQLKKSLGALDWAVKRLNSLLGVYNTKLKGIRQFGTLKEIRREFYGRASSVLKQINPNLAFLEESRRIIRNFPSLRTEIPTVAIAGYPNVGKSSIINRLKGYGTVRVSSQPGFTRGKQYVSTTHFFLIDTPGVIPREEKDDVKHLKMVSKPFDQEDPELAVFQLMDAYPGLIEQHFGIGTGGDHNDALEGIARKRNWIGKGGLPDTMRTAKAILQLWQDAKITPSLRAKR